MFRKEIYLPICLSSVPDYVFVSFVYVKYVCVSSFDNYYWRRNLINANKNIPIKDIVFLSLY